MKKIIDDAIDNHRQAIELLKTNSKKIEEIAILFISALKNKGKIIFMGNGGSAADAQHLAAELVGRFKKNRAPLAAITLSANTSILTAVGNDFGFQEIFARQIDALAGTSDLIVGISTSGESENVIRAIIKAKERGLKTIGFLGKDGGKIKNIVDVSLIIPSYDTPRIQEMHILTGHIVCEIVEEHFTKN
ncbi:MAG: D-sedoheptulose 7-phosphate isomerase [Candidatus Omnitrophica bacterium]|nr:D-sedoheptulose 7-phosphate isomerase [Candidatus Omnitrophota bacterium]MBU0878736.1 D-sedoheptulose 7-phosphate isomerase [Candidatus Omnitrophota bacterium]MBU0896445.1 D-sedoheptulose 7-phosphate isomerase [Candidatus Omnitrophota bacterium]MBU1134726.1 D-sedoheptulose 7-phosphate isomerase [Candidatus Omnitrophota bacterium]MBU1366753.1 D-sedoheptulose 7-phosphate isomerase [Candidatus Omnitrophota bacterium]